MPNYGWVLILPSKSRHCSLCLTQLANTACVGADTHEGGWPKQATSQKWNIISSKFESKSDLPEQCSNSKKMKKNPAGVPHWGSANEKRRPTRPTPAQASPHTTMIRPNRQQLPPCIEWKNPHEYFNFTVNTNWKANKPILAAQIKKLWKEDQYMGTFAGMIPTAGRHYSFWTTQTGWFEDGALLVCLWQRNQKITLQPDQQLVKVLSAPKSLNELSYC